MNAERFDTVLVSVLFAGLCVWLAGSALSWVITQAKKKGAIHG